MNSLTVTSPKVRSAIRKFVPIPLRPAARWAAHLPKRIQRALHLAGAKYRIDSAARHNTRARILHYDVRINKGTTPYYLYEDIFVNRVYHFEAQRPDPLILDCGSNMGMSVLYFKHVYPRSRIIAFEPDPTIFDYLRENIERNGLEDVRAERVALAATSGTLILNSDGEVASHLSQYPTPNLNTTPFEVPAVRLSDYLTEPVDFMKMNIEGAEWEVLGDTEPKLRLIREMSIEYHRLPDVPCTLHAILDLLHRNGFTYVVSDFGLMMYGKPTPPARVNPGEVFWRQIYALRND